VVVLVVTTLQMLEHQLQ
jgi:hypothetical protein